ncbi:MAG: hypothetical protein U1A78_11095 [Polyangia bacterium]
MSKPTAPSSVRSASESAPRATTRRSALRSLSLLALAGAVASGAGDGDALAGGKMPEDILAGQLIVSDSSFPTRWTSAAAFASECKKKHKAKLHFAKKTENKKSIWPNVQIYYAAFFSKPVNDVEVRFVLYDITNGLGAKVKKGSWEAFLNKKGDRVLFNSVELDKEDLFGDDTNPRKYQFAIEHRGQILAKTELTLTAEPEKFSGKVEFSDEETKKKQ